GRDRTGRPGAGAVRWGREEEPEPEQPEEVPTSFNWGLAPSGAEASGSDDRAEPAVDPAPTQAWTPPPLIEPPAALEAPTVPSSPPPAVELPTQAMAWQAPPLDAALGGATELFTPEPLGADTPVAE